MNSISGIVNGPAAIQFGSIPHPVPKILDEVRMEESDTEDIPVLQQLFPPVPWHLSQPQQFQDIINETDTPQTPRRAPRLLTPILSTWHLVRSTIRNINLPSRLQLPWLQRRSAPQPQSTPTTISLAIADNFPPIED
jgi:hypothetical protein